MNLRFLIAEGNMDSLGCGTCFRYSIRIFKTLSFLIWNGIRAAITPTTACRMRLSKSARARVDREGHVVSRFSELICPRVYKRLDKHIKQVTGITEQELAQGRPFSDVFGDFISWCGEDAQLVTWGRDDYPVLKRNAAFFMTPMPFDPPIDAQLVFGFCCLGGGTQAMNLHAAMEQMNVELDVAAHRAVNDAECTAALRPLWMGRCRRSRLSGACSWITFWKRRAALRPPRCVLCPRRICFRRTRWRISA